MGTLRFFPSRCLFLIARLLQPFGGWEHRDKRRHQKNILGWGSNRKKHILKKNIFIGWWCMQLRNPTRWLVVQVHESWELSRQAISQDKWGLWALESHRGTCPKSNSWLLVELCLVIDLRICVCCSFHKTPLNFRGNKCLNVKYFYVS